MTNPSAAAPPLVLASASPRRAALLTMLGLAHEVLPAHVDETFLADETPRDHVERLAREKAWAIADARPDALVLAADTVVVLDEAVLGKPRDGEEATTMLLSLAGRSHVVATGVALAGPEGGMRSRVDRVRVRFRSFDRATAEAYVATGEPLDKAGAYGIQGLGAGLVEGIEGDYYAVVGLSVAGMLVLFEEEGWRYAFGAGLRPLRRR